MSKKIYVARTGLLTAVGCDSEMVGAVFRTGLSAYQRANYFTHDHHLIFLAQVPEESLPPITDVLAKSTQCSLRDQRLVRMFQVAAEEALQDYSGEPIPLFLAGPENYAGLRNQIDRTFFSYLAEQVDLPIDYETSRINSLGRTGVLDAIRHAYHYLLDLEYPYVLVGGVDTGQNSAWLQQMDLDERVKSERPGSTDTFVPGDGAGCLLLTADPAHALRHNNHVFTLLEPGFAEEPGHLYSDASSLCEGLHLAVSQALRHLAPQQRISTVYSSINGESYWIKELGVAMTRASEHLHNLQHEHPADTYGDLGAATGAALISLACYDMCHTAAPAPSLITTASDHAYRAAVCVVPEKY